jgi:nonsense-mediated mRNA decay protein 3
VKAPCYLCGEPAVLEGLCATCFAKENPLLVIPPVITLQCCKRCGAVKIPGGWKKIPATIASDPEEMLYHQIGIAIQREAKIRSEDVQLSIEEEKRLDRVFHVIVIAEGKSDPSLEAHQEEYPVEVRQVFATCDTCGMASGGYHEAILQVRADSRELTEEEAGDISQLVTELTISEYESDAMAFVTQADRDRYGLDFKIGSEHLTRQVADELESRYLAERKETYKLVGQDKGGKDKFRVTILIRLPRFSIGDFVRIDGNPCQVLAMSKGGLTCLDLITRERFTINPKSVKWRSLEYIAPLSDKREYMVTTYVFGQPVQLMDSKTFDIVEVEENAFDFEVVQGATVEVIILDERHLILPRVASTDADSGP